MAMSNLSDVSVVSVSFNSAGILPEMISTLPKGVRLIVVDNGGDDHDALDDLSRKHGFDLVRSPVNLGFGTACNLGARHSESQFILFLNPDAKLRRGAIEALLACADQRPDAVGFGPIIRNADGTVLVRGICRILPKDALSPYRDAPVDRDVDLPILSGAALMVRRQAFEAVGGFDEHIFLYFEDDDLSLRLRANGASLVRVAAAEVLHGGGQSSADADRISILKNYEWSRARVYVTRKHAMPSPVFSALKEALRNLFRPTRDGLRQGPAARVAMIAGTISAWRDGGARRA